ncbi:MAG: dihydrofolate reductase [Chloroflexi bacterium]|nr:MAG: dihydrofolate reductase [Chloroflexota bacterium]MBL1192805.1 dihydrofolate reductase [Chloroflexota bacterium]NOH10099.1 dihydrofolate reductase [Chloroflexota bacterium]
MRKIIILTFVSLDGVMQAPGGPEEDTSGNFKHGGWSVPYFDEALGQVMGKQTGKALDMLLGRKTYQVMAAHWPNASKEEGADVFNNAKKYVASNTLNEVAWQNSELLQGEIADAIMKIKQEDGSDLQVHGSSELIQTLLKHDLVDELWLKIFPVLLGSGKRLFGDGTQPSSFALVDAQSLPSGVMIANYKRAGEIKTGSF